MIPTEPRKLDFIRFIFVSGSADLAVVTFAILLIVPPRQINANIGTYMWLMVMCYIRRAIEEINR